MAKPIELTETSDEVEVVVNSISLDIAKELPCLMLSPVENEEDIFVPVWVGLSEADSIMMTTLKQESPRPMTHDLFADFINRIGMKITKAVVTNMVDGTFFAILCIVVKDKSIEFQLDSRPSDAIAMALRFDAPVFVKRNVLEESKLSPEEVKDYKTSVIEQLQNYKDKSEKDEGGSDGPFML